MHPLPVVPIYIPGYHRPRLVQVLEPPLFEFVFEGMEEALGEGVVVAVALPGHRLGHAQKLQPVPDDGGAVLDPPVGVEDQPLQVARGFFGGIHKSRRGVSCLHGRGDVPALDLPVEQVDHHHEVAEAGVRRQVGEVRCPDPVLFFRTAVLDFEEPRRLPGTRLVHGRLRPESLFPLGYEALLPHEPCDPVLADPLALRKEATPYPRGAVPPLRLLEDAEDLGLQAPVAGLPAGGSPPEPVVEARGGDI